MYSEPENFWKDDVLGRRDDALYLQKYIIARYKKKKREPGFVLAINADWGFGKSFMLSRFFKQAQYEGHPTIFFDAWQSDFTSDPLLGFIAELDLGLQKYFRALPVGPKLSKASIGAIKRAWKPALMVLGSAVLKHSAGVALPELLASIKSDSVASDSAGRNFDIDGLKKNLQSAVEGALKKHNTLKESITEFRDKLGELITALETAGGSQMPLIIFIDELDRCRPDYAIELLEGIKHLFGVPGVFFVIATNVKQLSESIKAVYGAGFDGRKYLDRFFDLQYLLPEPNTGDFAVAIFQTASLPTLPNIIYGLEELHPSPGNLIVSPVPVQIFSYVLKLHVEAFGLGLRDILQIYTVVESSLIALNFSRVHPFLLIFLAVIFHKDQEVFIHLERTHSVPSDDRMSKMGYRSEYGNIEFLAYDDNGRGRRKVVGLLEIVSFYLLMLDSQKLDRHIQSGEYNFPKNWLIENPCVRRPGCP